MSAQPTVSIILPVLNEAAHIENCLGSLVAQDYPETVEILVAEGGSTDATRSILETLASRMPILRVIDNPDRVQSHGLNRLIAAAAGDVVVRTDAHTTYAPDYVRRSVAALDEHHAAMVGGPMVAQGRTPTEMAIAIAMRSPWAAGPSTFRNLTGAGEADTVYLGAFATATLRAVGGYRSFTSGVAEDADLAFRIRRQIGPVVQDPSIRSWYRPRPSIRRLGRQFFRYGRGKAEMIRVNRAMPSWRPLAPLGLVLSLVAGVILGFTGVSWLPLVGILCAWPTAVIALSVQHGRLAHLVAISALTMHLAYGLGFARGILTSRVAVARMAATDTLI